MIKLGAMATLLVVGAAQASAATSITNYPVTTNYLVQNVSFALSAYVQQGGTVLYGSLPTKQFLAFLSGVTNPAVASSTNVVPTTNSVYTNLTVLTTNFWLLPTNDFLRSYVVSSDYWVTPDGASFYTNNINFTNDILVTRTSDSNVTYTFNNTVTVPTNRTAYLFPELQASSVTAQLTTNEPGAVFALSGQVITNVIGMTTNYTHTNTTPDFTKQSGAKLLCVTPIVSFLTNYPTYITNKIGTNVTIRTNLVPYVTGNSQPSKYVVRYTAGKTNFDTDVSSFLYDSSSPYLSLAQSLGSGAVAVYGFTQINFDNQAGTSFSFVGFDTQQRGPLAYRGNLISTSAVKQRKMAAGNYSGQISGHIQNRTFDYSTAVVTGSITIGSGKIE